MAAIIDIRRLVKTFGATRARPGDHPDRHRRALDGLDLVVDAGEVHGFLGPNGAGKSTTIRILLGMLRATSGEVAVLGRDPWRDAVEVHRDIAYVPGDVTLWPNLSGGETIDFLTRLRGGADAARRARLLRDFDLDPRTKGRAYSKGNRQKVALVAAFARPASLYVFDEPTSGLDPVMEAVFRSEVERVRDDGATVLLSSHILSEVEQLCDRVTIIRAGRTVESGALADLRHLTRTTFRVGTTADPSAFSAVPGATDVRREGDRVVFDVDTEALDPALAALGRIGVTALSVAPASLEQLFLRHYRINGAAERREATAR